MSTVKLAPQTEDVTLVDDWLQQARQTGRTDAYAGKRRYPRTTWDAALEVHVPKSAGRTVTHYASARDISEGGIGLQWRRAVPDCTVVRICPAGELKGVSAMVMHCTQTLNGYIIGLEFRFDAPEETQATTALAG
ncbi:MAG: PilZ domain-containing protein [bacterium]|nr:PilZ domain-containing protein [bacterium]